MPPREEAMLLGADRYRDLLDRLAGRWPVGGFPQTGGKNAAQEVLLDGGHTLLVTDLEESMARDRSEHRGWSVGLYAPDQANTDGSAWRSTWSRTCLAEALLRQVPGGSTCATECRPGWRDGN